MSWKKIALVLIAFACIYPAMAMSCQDAINSCAVNVQYCKYIKTYCTFTTSSAMCTEPTEHFSSGCEMLNYYDTDDDCYISDLELQVAIRDWLDNKITDNELNFVMLVWSSDGGINAVCPGCCPATAPQPSVEITNIVGVGTVGAMFLAAAYLLWRRFA